MFKSTRLLLIVFLFGLGSLSFPSQAWACSPPISGNLTIGTSCSFTGTVNGVDAGTGTSNSATITINSPATLTINAAQTVAFGTSITINTGASIAINAASGTQIRQVALWMTDADADNYPSSTTQIAQSATPTSGRRRNVMSTVSSTDCNDSSSTTFQNLTCYTDSDGDGYGAGAGSSVCSGSSCASGVSNASDCYDSNLQAFPGQTAYFTTTRGDGSWDYNCNGSTDMQYSSRVNCCTANCSSTTTGLFSNSTCTSGISPTQWLFTGTDLLTCGQQRGGGATYTTEQSPPQAYEKDAGYNTCNPGGWYSSSCVGLTDYTRACR